MEVPIGLQFTKWSPTTNYTTQDPYQGLVFCCGVFTCCGCCCCCCCCCCRCCGKCQTPVDESYQYVDPEDLEAQIKAEEEEDSRIPITIQPLSDTSTSEFSQL
ncbi:UNVERIFIED_CONTAM: hypothetical protein FKN15_037585 [Acipenser sinensis]